MFFYHCRSSMCNHIYMHVRPQPHSQYQNLFFPHTQARCRWIFEWAPGCINMDLRLENELLRRRFCCTNAVYRRVWPHLYVKGIYLQMKTFGKHTEGCDHVSIQQVCKCHQYSWMRMDRRWIGTNSSACSVSWSSCSVSWTSSSPDLLSPGRPCPDLSCAMWKL
jgi:hypothetical protein